MITLFQFHPIWGLPNASPFCMKLETYLRMAKIPYESKYINNPQTAPKGKLPFIKLDGVVLPDSELIIAELKNRFGDALDETLSKEKKALAVLIDIIFTERLYWIEMFLRWQDDAGWKVTNDTMFGGLPFFLKFFIPKMIRKKMFKTLNSQGMGRHSYDEVVGLGIKTLNGLADFLDDKPFFLGDKPSSLDATAFAFLANIIMAPVNDAFKKHARSLDNLKLYVHRMWDLYYSDLTKPEIL